MVFEDHIIRYLTCLRSPMLRITLSMPEMGSRHTSIRNIFIICHRIRFVRSPMSRMTLLIQEINYVAHS